MKISKAGLFLVLTTCALASCRGKGGGGGGGGGSTWKDYDKYYKGYKIDKFTGADLIQEVHYYFIDQHKTYVKYSDYWSKNKNGMLDKDFNGVGEGFYTARTNVTGGVDREHVWPCALSADLWYRSTQYVEHNVESGNYIGGGSDLFHVRPACSSVNQARGSGLFYEYTDAERNDSSKTQFVTDSSGKAGYGIWIDDLAWKSSSSDPAKTKKVEVVDGFKGDVARIVMYLWCHYRNIGNKNVYYKSQAVATTNQAEAIKQSSTHTPVMCGSLDLKGIIGYNNIVDCYKLLKRWNKVDLPSDVEKNRNNLVQQIQGNRNPFIDYPELMDRCLDELIEEAGA